MSIPIPLPNWAKKLLSRMTCSHCHRRFNVRGVVGLGIRRMASGQPALFAEVDCDRCGRPSLCLFNQRRVDPARFIRTLNDAIVDSDWNPLAEAVRKHQDQQTRAALDAVSDHDQFLRKIGLTDEQIREWANRPEPSDDGVDEENDKI